MDSRKERGGEMNHESLADLASRVEAGLVKALSIKQPYPHHIFHDDKDVENRDWPTKGRGWFIIHAGFTTATKTRLRICASWPRLSRKWRCRDE